MYKPIRIGLVLPCAHGYYRGIARGVRLDAATRPRWTFTSMIREEPPRWTLGVGKPDGLIACVEPDAMADVLGRLHRPLVNVSSVLLDQPFPRVGVDNHAV